jgi:hypothetical protein
LADPKFAAIAAGIGFTATVTCVTAAVLFAPVAPFCVVPLFTTGFALLGLEAGILAADPFDPNYTLLAEPLLGTIDTPDISNAAAMFGPAFSKLLSSEDNVYACLGALYASSNRYESALARG